MQTNTSNVNIFPMCAFELFVKKQIIQINLKSPVLPPLVSPCSLPPQRKQLSCTGICTVLFLDFYILLCLWNMFVKCMEQIMYFKLYMYFTLGVEFWQLLFLLPNLLVSEFVLLYYPGSFFSCCVLLHLMKISQFIYLNWFNCFTKISDPEVNVLVYVSLGTHMTRVFLAYVSVDLRCQRICAKLLSKALISFHTLTSNVWEHSLPQVLIRFNYV